MAEPVLTQFTIYERPLDYPAGFVVREWHITRGQLEPQPGRAWRATSIDDARMLVPAGMFCFGREQSDDPSIVETWT